MKGALDHICRIGVLFTILFSGWGKVEAKAVHTPGLHLLRSDQNGVLIELNTPNYQLTPETELGKSVHRLEVPGAPLKNEPGQPILPVFSTLLGIPGDVEVRLRVVEDKKVLLAGKYNITLAPKPALLEEDLQPGTFAQDSGNDISKYSTLINLGADGYYPARPAEIGNDAWLRDQRMLSVELYPFQYDPVKKIMLWHRTLLVEIQFIRSSVNTSVVEVGLEQEDALSILTHPSYLDQTSIKNPFEGVLQSTLLNYEQSRIWRSLPQISQSQAQSTQSLGPRFKIVVDHDGFYKLSYDDLRQAGMPVERVNPATFHMISQGRDVAIQFIGDGDRYFEQDEAILFFGQKFRGDILAARYAAEDDSWLAYGDWQPQLNATMFEKYTDENVYWLLVGGAPGPRMASLDGSPHNIVPTPDYYYEKVHAEESHEWWTWHFTSEDTWFWEIVERGQAEAVTRTYTTTLTALAGGDLTATVRAEIVAWNYNANLSPDHHTRFSINDRSAALEDITWDGRTRHSFEAQIPQSALQEGENQLHFTNIKTAALPYGDKIYFNWFEVEYPRRFQAINDQLNFSRDEKGTRWRYEISNFTSGSVQAYDITDTFNPTQVLSTTLTGGVAAFEGEHPAMVNYLIVGENALQVPKSLSFYSPPDLFSSSNGADYIFITHQKFYTTTLTLANYRSWQGMRTRVVDVADLYNEFSDGIFTPLAIKSFLVYAYSHWQPPAPAYVLLIGSGHWNLKGYKGITYNYWSKPIYMPPNLVFVDPWQGEVDSANLLANVSGDDIFPDLSIGRLPVDTIDQLQAVIQKIINYEQSSSQSWQKHLLFLADNIPDDAGDFIAASNGVIADSVPLDYQVDRIYLNNYGCPPGLTGLDPCPQVRVAITSTLNITGALFLNFIGHGDPPRWTNERVFRVTAVPGDQDNPLLNNTLLLNNGDRLPVVLSMTCLDGYWIHTLPEKVSLAVELVRAANKGAVSTFSPTGLGVSTGHDVLNRAFYDAVFKFGINRLGPATLASKLALYRTNSNYDLIDTFTIFGDPALRIPVTYTRYIPIVKK